MARILVVEDDPGVRRGVARMVAALGHEVEDAPNGRVGLERFQAEDFDLVITDINMPEMDGIELMMAVTKSERRVPVIAMSAGGRMPGELLLENANLLGAVATIGKPFDVEELIEAVEIALSDPTTDG